MAYIDFQHHSKGAHTAKARPVNGVRPLVKECLEKPNPSVRRTPTAILRDSGAVTLLKREAQSLRAESDKGGLRIYSAWSAQLNGILNQKTQSRLRSS